jgi:hypothetical protein
MTVRATEIQIHSPTTSSSPTIEPESPESDLQKQSPNGDNNVDPLWSILPSYHMYNALYRGIHIDDNEADNDDLPPIYDRHSVSIPSLVSDPTYEIGGLTPSQHTTQSNLLSQSSSQGEDSRFILADEQTNWQETILDNTHLLKNLTETNNPNSNAISIKIHFTKDICQVGKKQVEIDPSLFEYKQGDYLNGYVVIKNDSDTPIPFEMFYLVFEGTMKIFDSKSGKFKHSRNFLQMFDFSGSWNDGHINRLITEFENPYECPDVRDSLDGSFLSFANHKEIMPNRLYKRFFTFKIPNFLLDTECNEHNLSTHVQLPPSMGCPTVEKLGRHKAPVKDFSMQDSAITYGVLARFVGRKSKYNVDKSLFKSDDAILVNSKGDEFLILKEEYNFVRILQQSHILSKSEQAMKYVETKLLYDNLTNRVREKIEFGKQLRDTLENQDFDTSIDMTRRFSDTDLELSKRRQDYQSGTRDIKHNPAIKNEYSFNYLLKKKFFSGSVKEIGTLQICTPKKEYPVKYIPPKQFRLKPITDDDTKSWTLDIPLDLTYSFPHLNERGDIKKIPHVKSIFADLVVLTVKSDKYPIPVEFHHDIIYQPSRNKAQPTTAFRDTDTFENNVVKPMQSLSNDLYHIAKELGENFKMEKQLVDDIKAICQLQSKANNLWICDAKIKTDTETVALSPKAFNSIPWERKGNSQYSKRLNLVLNLESAVLKTLGSSKTLSKAYDSFCLVPNFQYCRMARLYFIRLSIGLSNNEIVHIKLPVSIQK